MSDKTRSILIVMTLLSAAVHAQDFQKEINDQVWKPFIKSFNSLDTDGFMAVHSKDVVRSPRDSKILLNWDEYYKLHQESDKREKKGGATRTIDLRFSERISNSRQAIDIGIYRATVTTKDGKSASYTYYGRFHVVLRKESGTWKILVDTDSSSGVTDQDFKAASPME
jgi:ketosteroid isomerase-like protein